MRYISQISNLVLLTNGGDIGRDDSSKKKYSFGQHGELIIGSLTTASGTGNYIDAGTLSDPSDQLMLVYPTDLDGNAVTRLEMAGLGTLDGVTKTSGSVSPLNAGHRLFFEAPNISGGTAVSGTAGVWYKVLTGAVTYASVVYVAGESFETDGSNTETSGTAVFRLSIPPELKKTCENPEAVAGLFAYKHLQTGREGTKYWNYGHGIVPKDSTTSNDPDYFGWVD
jgi:hypothetical protein